MKAVYKFLFPIKPDDTLTSFFLLGMRVLFGAMLMWHGIQKLSHFSEMSATFPDPLGLGSSVSLSLAIFGELFCSLGFIFGVFYRLALIPMIFTMCIAFFVIHGGDPFSAKELAFAYLAVFVLMYIIGPGKYSIDRYIGLLIHKKKISVSP